MKIVSICHITVIFGDFEGFFGAFTVRRSVKSMIHVF